MDIEQGRLAVDFEAGNRIQFGDIYMEPVVLSNRMGSGVAVQEWELGPHKLGAPPHRHEHEDEVFYVLAGEVMVMQDDEVVTAGPGNYVVLPRGHFHTFWNAGDVPVRLLVILSPGQLEEYFQKAGRLVRPGVPPDMDQLAPLAQKYGLSFQLERIPALMGKYGLQSDVPPPPLPSE